jgi:hypothetical protein
MNFTEFPLSKVSRRRITSLMMLDCYRTARVPQNNSLENRTKSWPHQPIECYWKNTLHQLQENQITGFAGICSMTVRSQHPRFCFRQFRYRINCRDTRAFVLRVSRLGAHNDHGATLEIFASGYKHIGSIFGTSSKVFRKPSRANRSAHIPSGSWQECP